MQRLPKMSTPIWAMLGVWTVMCGFVTMHSIGLMGQWKQRANGFQHNNAYLARELSLMQQQLQQTRTELAVTRTHLAATQNQVLVAQTHGEAKRRAEEKVLFEAIRRSDAHAVNVLLDAGVDSNSYEGTMYENGTALDQAIAVGYVTTSDPNLQNSLAVVRALVKHGADVNRRDLHGRTSPLTIARSIGSDALIALLEAAGAKE